MGGEGRVEHGSGGKGGAWEGREGWSMGGEGRVEHVRGGKGGAWEGREGWSMGGEGREGWSMGGEHWEGGAFSTQDRVPHVPGLTTQCTQPCPMLYIANIHAGDKSTSSRPYGNHSLRCPLLSCQTASSRSGSSRRTGQSPTFPRVRGKNWRQMWNA